jgi:hypothetical protein
LAQFGCSMNLWKFATLLFNALTKGKFFYHFVIFIFGSLKVLWLFQCITCLFVVYV